MLLMKISIKLKERGEKKYSSKNLQVEKQGDYIIVSGRYFERVLWFDGNDNPITMERCLIDHKIQIQTQIC